MRKNYLTIYNRLMRKNILTIIFQTGILILAFNILKFTEGILNPGIPINDFINELESQPTLIEIYYDLIMGIIAFTLFSISFIILRIYMNKIYKGKIEYLKYFVIGSTSSVIAISLFYSEIKISELHTIYGFTFTFKQFSEGFLKHIFMIPLFSFFLIINCGIIALCFNWLMPKLMINKIVT